MHLATSPDEGKRIASYTAQMLADMRRETDLRRHRARWVAWLDWAEANHVCAAVRSHVVGVNAEMERALKGRQQVRNPAGGD